MALETMVDIRRHLHQIPEIAGKEEKTREFIRSKIRQKTSSIHIDYDNEHGIIAKYHYDRDAPTLAFRAELDGLPIKDRKKFNQYGKSEGVR